MKQSYQSIFKKNRFIFKVLQLTQFLGDRVSMKLAKWYNSIIFKQFQLKRISAINNTEVKEYIKNMENYVFFQDGYGKIELDENLISNLVLASNQVINDNKNTGSHKGFMDNYLQDEHLKKYPIFLNIALNPRIIFSAIKYCGYVPTLNSIKLLKSEAKKSNDTTLKNYTSSQLYHLDQPDDPYFKVIININNVCQNSGPFTFIKKTASKKLQEKVKSGILRSAFVNDEIAYKYINKYEDEIRLVGEPGTCHFVDSSNCFHRGSRDNTKERLILMFSYVSAARADFRDLPNYKKFLDNIKKTDLTKMVLDHDV